MGTGKQMADGPRSQSRRDFLKVVGAGSAIAMIAACAPPGTATPSASAAPVSQIKRGGTVTIPNVGNPNLEDINNDAGLIGLVYQSLMEFRASDFNDNTIVGLIAEKWEFASDATSLTITLRKGVKWHNLPPVNGRPVTSADVAWTAEYYLKNSVSKVLYDVVDRVETPDPQTAIFRLKRPSVSFLGNLLDKRNRILPREVFEQDGSFQKRAVGTGPFMVKEFVPNVKTVFVRNPDYYEMGEDGKPLPYLDEITSITQTDGQARLAALRSGQVVVDSPTGTQSASEAASLKAGGLTIAEGIAVFTRNLFMKLDHPVLKDKRVRQAIMIGIDRDGWIRTQYEGEGAYQSFVPLPGWGYDQAALKTKFKQDVAKATALVKEAGAVGTKLKISGLAAATAGLNSKGAEFLAADLKTIGLDVTLDVYPGMPQLLQSVLNPAKFDLLLHVTNGNGVDPTSYGQLWSSGIAAGGGNYASIKDPQIDALVAAQDKEVDATKRKALVRQLEDYLYDNAILAPLAQPKIFKGRSAKLKGANVYHGSQKWVNWQRVWFDQ